MDPAKLQLRPITDEDKPFLAKLYASTRLEEMAQSGWTDQQIDEFLQWQFEAQHKHYQEFYAESAFDLIEYEGRPVGRLYVERRDDELRIVDIAFMPECRGHGLGTHLIQGLFQEARRRGVGVGIHVEANNPAMRLYQRLKFKHVDTNGVYHLMKWTP